MNKVNYSSEEWKQIPDFENYEISKTGKIRSKPIFINCKNGSRRFKEGRLMKPNKKKTGYLEIGLKKEGKRIYKTIHRLVMLTFKGESNLVVDHLNGNKEDNRLENLEYLTARENTTRFWAKQNTVSRYTGVTKKKNETRWTAQIIINYKCVRLGKYDTEKEAYRAYKNKLDEITAPQTIN